MAWALERLDEPLDLDDARGPRVHERPHVHAPLPAATGTTPGRWLLEQRVRASLPLLEAIGRVDRDRGRDGRLRERGDVPASLRLDHAHVADRLPARVLRGHGVGREARAAAVQAAHHGADRDLQLRRRPRCSRSRRRRRRRRPRAAPAGSAPIAAITSRVWRISTGSPPAGATSRVSSGSSGASTGRRSRVRSERDVRVAQRLVQVRAGAGGADRARPGEHLQQRVLDQILGVLTGAGHATSGAAQRVDVDGKRLGEEFLGHASRLPISPPLPIWGNSP